MEYQDNRYLSLTTYPEIYRELVYQRNGAIRWLDEHGLLNRRKIVSKGDHEEQQRHQSAAIYRPLFRDNILQLLDRLYSHDAIEAIYDFNAVELGDWSDTEANRLERELQRLQHVIGKLEIRYKLQYKLILEYRSAEHTLYLNNIEVISFGRSSIKHRLLTALYSDPSAEWENNSIEDYFIEQFSYQEGSLKDSQIRKAADDIVREVAAKGAIKDFLKVSNSAVRVNPFYLL